MTIKCKVLWLHQRAHKIGFLLFLLFPFIKGHAQGLLFNSNDSLVGKRTSYEVFKKNVPAFSDHLQIKFDLSLWDNDHLGYIFSITDQQHNSYSLSYLHTDTVGWLNFNIDSKSNKIKIPLAISQLEKRKWMKVTVDLNLAADRVTILFNGRSYTAHGFGFSPALRPKIIFGKNERYSEVPNMAIKNLIVNDSHSVYSFPLNEWAKNGVHDQDGEVVGEVQNPVWLINESYFWTARLVKSFDEIAGLNYDDRRQQLFIFDKDHLTTYDTEHDKLAVQAYQNPLPLVMILGKSIINTKENKLYSYEANRVKENGPNVAALDLNTLKWKVEGSAMVPQQRHHHNIFYDQKQEQFFLFGGYGSFAYYNDFFAFNKMTDHWDRISFSGDTIRPRFFSGCSAVNERNEVYIFGGYGNETGSQVVGGRNFYDLYRVNLSTRSIKKCWEIVPKGNDFVPANNLIISKDQKYFYALCYPHSTPKTTLRLYRFSIKDGSFQLVSGAIPVTSERIESDINLFFNPKLQEFVCAIQEFTDVKHSIVKLYSLYAPPISRQEYLNSYDKKPPSRIFFFYGVFLILLLLGGGLIFFFVKRKTIRVKLNELSARDEELPSCDPDIQEKRINAVYLLGEFIVYDKNQRNVTYLFSPKLKQLFVLILLHSQDGAGVVSKKISSVLWPDKEISRTKNIKGVTINHLRNVIADIDGIELTFLNDTYCFSFSPQFFCDYFAVIRQISKPASTVSIPEIFDHFDLIARGSLLPFIPEPWLDDFKLVYEEALIRIFLPELKKSYALRDLKKVQDITRIILNIDPFHEEALQYKLKGLRRTKGIVYAHKIYSGFALEYKRSMGVDYPVPFDQICAGDVK
ncbi:hypothetical protein [Pedobacter sp. L105]|uniref:Kelch repeat-containing protein n=1 Tax=Pedobacter sp. L105 TaxID=1641871 RepID=UPI00131DAEF4|nr:hypothetical protein [Pedobacter sp. L105]